LGRALLTITPSGATVAAARSALLDELGGETRAGYWLAVDTLSPGRPSALEPRGTFAALVEGGRGSVDVERRTLLSEPLRVAVLSNGGARQAALARAALERWIKALRADIVPCAEPVPQQARSGEFTLETPSSGEPEGAYVAVALPALGSGARAAVEATLFLLNRPGGWLEQALSNLPARAQAGFLGGAQTAGLVIRVASTADGEEQAVRQVRGLLVRLARGSATAEDLVLARRALAQTELEGRLDPRRRLVELWRGSESVQELELGTLRAFHGRFEGATQAAVNVRARP
jgi:hypothetical protein